MKLAVNAVFVFAVGILIFVGLVSVDSTQRLVASQRFVEHTHEVREALLSLTKEVSESAAGRRAYIITGDSRYLAPHLNLLHTYSLKLAQLKQLTKDNPSQMRRIETVAPLIKAKLENQLDSIAYYKNHPNDLKAQAAFTERGTRVGEQLDTAFRAMSLEEARLLEVRAADQKHRTDGAVFVGLVGTLLGIGMLSSVVLAIRRQVIRRTRAEAKLAVESSILESILASMSDGVVVSDTNGKFLHYNAAAKRMTKRANFDAPPGEWTDEVHMFQRDAVTPCLPSELPLVRAMNGETVESEELYIVRSDGGIWLEINGAPLADGRGHHRGGVVVMRDVTERRQARDEIDRLNRELASQVTALAAVNKELETFSYSVSHDLRSPLRSIDGFSQALMEDYGDKLEGDGIDYLNRIRAAIQRMGRLIDDMLSLSRITRREMVSLPIDLSGLAGEVVADLQASDPDRTVEVEIQSGISVEGDPTLMRTLLENLLGNAWKFTSKRAGASIVFGVESNDKGELCCFIRDNGAGFDPDYTHKLFGVFERLHSMEEFRGTGVGLATVQRVVQRHGGRIWAEGEVDKGAKFTFSLPGLIAHPHNQPTIAGPHDPSSCENGIVGQNEETGFRQRTGPPEQKPAETL